MQPEDRKYSKLRLAHKSLTELGWSKIREGKQPEDANRMFFPTSKSPLTLIKLRVRRS